MFRKGGNSVCIGADNVRKIHTTFADGSELVEEYDSRSHQLLVRKRRGSRKTGAANSWDMLMGDERQASGSAAGTKLLITEGSSNPRCARVDSPGFFTWTINNLPYLPDTYKVTADPQTTTIVVATSNKKYYKRLDLPEMTLLKLVLAPSRLSWSHQGDTLTVQYSKPPALLAEELADVRDAMSIRVQEDAADCRQQ